MKNIKYILLLIPIMMYSNLFATEKKGVKSETIFEYNVREEFGEYNEMLSGKVKIKYNKHGQRLKYSSNDYKNKYKYNKNEQLIQNQNYNFVDSIYTNKIFEYDSTGNIIKEIRINDKDEMLSWYNFQYDQKGRNTKEFQYNSDSLLILTCSLNYNEMNQVTDKSCFSDNGNLKNDKYGISRYIYEYNNKNKPTQEQLYSESGELLSNYKINYDANGNMVDRTQYDINGKIRSDQYGISRYIYKYDSNNNMIEERHYNSNGSLIRRFSNEYNDYNHIISRSEYLEEEGFDIDGNSLVSKTVYEYKYKKNYLRKFVQFFVF